MTLEPAGLGPPDPDRPTVEVALDRDGADADADAGVSALYRDRSATMVRLAHLLTGSNAVAQEVVQDAFG